MSLLFTNAVLAPLAVLAVVPLLVHLFARSRPPAYRFSAVDFVLRAVRHALRLKRPQDLLLLVLRTAVAALLVLAFLQPLLFANRRLMTPFEQRNVVVIVDATASMGYSAGGQSRFAEACAQASEVLAGLSARDRAAVVWLKPRPEAVLPELSPNLAHLRAALQRARVSAGAGDPAAAIDLAATLLAGAEGHREICIVSDFQVTGWRNVTPLLPPGIEWVSLRVGGGNGENGAVVDLACDPAVPLRGEPATLLCEVANFSPQPRRRTVLLEMRNLRRAVTVAVPAWGRASAAIPCRFDEPGPTPVAVSLDEDAFPIDDRRWTVVNVVDRLRVAAVGSQTGTGLAWRRALEATGWVDIVPVSSGDGLDAQEPREAVFAAEWDGATADTLRAAAGRGTAVIVSPARTLALAPLLALLGLPERPGAAAAWEAAEQARAVRVSLANDPLFAIFADGAFGDPARGRFRSRLAIATDALDGADVLMRYDDGVPALARARSHPVYFWNLPLDMGQTTWPAQPEFLVFMGELVLSHRPASATAASPVEYAPGDTLAFSPPALVPARDVRLCRQGEAVGTLSVRQRNDAQEVLAEDVADPGLYTWEQADRPLGVSIVNVPAAESDLRAGDPAALVRRETVRASGGRALRLLREGRSLWPLLIGLCIATALVEGAVAWWSERA